VELEYNSVKRSIYSLMIGIYILLVSCQGLLANVLKDELGFNPGISTLKGNVD